MRAVWERINRIGWRCRGIEIFELDPSGQVCMQRWVASGRSCRSPTIATGINDPSDFTSAIQIHQEADVR